MAQVTLTTVTVVVTSAHISRGRPKDVAYCPVALAITELLRPGVTALAGSNFLELRLANSSHVIGYSSTAVRQWMDRFDSGLAVDPFRFDLDLPKNCMRHTSAMEAASC